MEIPAQHRAPFLTHSLLSEMRTATIIATLSAALLSAWPFKAAGQIAYSLPSTTLHLKITAIGEYYTPGPYSRYASKYLGIDVPQEKSSLFRISEIELVPHVEADTDRIYTVTPGKGGLTSALSSFFKLTSQGLVMLPGADAGSGSLWRFPVLTGTYGTDPEEATDNIASTETTLYKSILDENGNYSRVAVTQSQTVEKNDDRKASEAASAIFMLRQKRMEIITGDTDATFGGDALRAAIEEINRLEEEYMRLFTGTTHTTVQHTEIDVIPETTQEEQISVAFRFSETEGVLLPDNMSGRPIVMEITPPERNESLSMAVGDDEGNGNAGSGRGRQPVRLFYRIPAICTATVSDGQTVLLRTRVPVYQAGKTLELQSEL